MHQTSDLATMPDGPAKTGELPAFYSKKTREFPLLTKEQEVELFQRLEEAVCKIRELQENSQASSVEWQYWLKQANEARNAIVEANLRLVLSIVHKSGNRGHGFLDLIQEGNVGLMNAVGKFDYRRGCRFSTYATLLIEQAISRGVVNHSRTIRIPAPKLKMIRKLKKRQMELEEDYGHENLDEVLAREMQMSVHKVRMLLALSSQTRSLDAPASDTGETRFGDLIEDPNAVNPMDQADHLLMADRLMHTLKALSAREKEVIEHRYGLKGKSSQLLGVIGSQLDVSSERVRQIESEALVKMRDLMDGPATIISAQEHVGQSADQISSLVKSDTAVVTPMTQGNWFRLVIRSIKNNANHHIWNNNGTWWCKFSLESNNGDTLRVSRSLKTKSIEGARIIRDRLLCALQSASGRIAA